MYKLPSHLPIIMSAPLPLSHRANFESPKFHNQVASIPSSILFSIIVSEVDAGAPSSDKISKVAQSLPHIHVESSQSVANDDIIFPPSSIQIYLLPTGTYSPNTSTLFSLSCPLYNSLLTPDHTSNPTVAAMNNNTIIWSFLLSRWKQVVKISDSSMFLQNGMF